MVQPMISKARRLGWRHLFSSWSARIQWGIIALGGAWEMVPGLSAYLPPWSVQGLAVCALLAKLVQNRERTR